MTDLEKRADEYAEVSTNTYKDCLVDIDDKDILKEAISEAYEDGATQETALLSQHILDLQKDKGNLTDRVRELDQQIEKMKNCKNCKKLKKEKDGLLICTVGSFYTNTFGKNCDKWEIKENE